MQPRRPHGQRAPPSLTTMWPISAAAPRPSQGLPSRIRPPPTPVPHQTPSTVLSSLPAPRWNSPSTATWTSLPSLTGAPRSFESASARGNDAVPAGKVLGARDDAGLLVGVAGRPDPDAGQLRRIDAALLGGLPQARRHLGGDVLGPALGRRRAPRLAEHLVARVDDDGLDLRPAEVDAAAGCCLSRCLGHG